MRAVVIDKRGTPVGPNIKLVHDWPDEPTPPPGSAVVRTLASALNHLDLWVAKGVPGLDLSYPRVSGSDACGIVESVGQGVSPDWIGKRVIVNAALPAPILSRPDDPPASTLAPNYLLLGEHLHGTLRERFTIPASNLAVIRDDQDPVEAAAFGLTFLTAYSMIVSKARVRPGQDVLITGIGGGVALAALSLAKYFSCPVAVTSRHEWKLKRAKELGADLCILDEGQDWSKQVRDWTNKRGVDLAVDSSGKATHLKCIKSLAPGGAYVTPGCTSGPDATTDLARIFWNQLRILGSTMGSCEEFSEVATLYRTVKGPPERAIPGSVVSPVIDQVFKVEEAAHAYERLESADQFGKVVINWS